MTNGQAHKQKKDDYIPRAHDAGWRRGRIGEFFDIVSCESGKLNLDLAPDESPTCQAG